MRGYWSNADETTRAFRDGLFRTGDIGYQDADGYVYILDRVKDMIVTGGENVYSGEVEAVIYEHPAGNRSAGGESYQAERAGGVNGRREGAGSLRIAAAHAAVK
jgi:acyl-CoA synthetase (AMP-forming)/AMP-acid ligase II